MKEIWRDIKGFEGKYMISNLGNVKSLNYLRRGKEKILKPGNNRMGYLQVVLCKNGICKSFKVHRLVGEAFIENPEELPQINHIDKNRHNNSVSNLEWCDNRYNIRYSSAKKVACWKNNKLIKIYDAIQDVKQDGFKKENVCICCKGKLKSHRGFRWTYVK